MRNGSSPEAAIANRVYGRAVQRKREGVKQIDNLGKDFCKSKDNEP